MKRDNFAELTAREKALAVLDAGATRELLDPFARLESPHLSAQDIVPQSDDGVVIARGKIGGRDAVVVSMEGGFQGGSVGEVNGAKIAGTLELTLRDARAGKLIFPVLLFDTGGIRLQEANLGLLAISKIHSAIVALRDFVPVLGVIAGRVGCFGGMSIAAALCTFLIGTEVGRLGLNGPEVIEQEAGVGEFDSRDRELIWQTLGCRRRLELGQINQLVNDSVDDIAAAVKDQVEAGLAHRQRTALRIRDIELQTRKLTEHPLPASPHISVETRPSGRGLRWFCALLGNPIANFEKKSVLVADTQWSGQSIRVISVVCNAHARFPRARQGQVGIEEGWGIAKAVWDAIDSDEGKPRRAIVAIVDVPGQAFGWHEEALGIHLALAAAVDAYVAARQLGHPVIALVVGKAISGAFLAHGLQADQILALDDGGVEVHVMSEASVARVTRRSAEQVASLARIVPGTARDVRSFAGLGGIDRLIKVDDAAEPGTETIENVRKEILTAIGRARKAQLELQGRLHSSWAQVSRAMSWQVRQELESQWTTDG
jgi:malonate decarboxylase beta subunit